MAITEFGSATPSTLNSVKERGSNGALRSQPSTFISSLLTRLLLLLNERPNECRDFVCFRVEREMSGIEHVHLGRGHVFAIAFRLAGIEREIVLAPDDEKLRLRLLHPRLPFRVRVDVRPVIVEEVALNLRLPRRVQECVFIGPKIGIVELNVGIVSDVARLCRLQRK